MHSIIAIILLLTFALLAFVANKLTLKASVTGFFAAILLWAGTGWKGIALLAVFFIAGSAATGFQSAKKDLITGSEGARTAGQVLANGGVAALLGMAAWFWPAQAGYFNLMIAGSLASATADTLSSELGTIYGLRCYNVLTLKKDKRGANGAISLEGTLIGAAGAAFMGMIYCLLYGWSIYLLFIIAAGIIGNYADSVLGATLERKHIAGNNMVNFLNTLTGALVCFALAVING